MAHCTCDYKLSSTYFRNFPDLLVTAVWYSQVMSAKLKFPIRTSRKTTAKTTKLKKDQGNPGGQNVEYE